MEMNILRGFFYFTRGEKRSILLLLAAVVIVFLSGHFISAWQRRGGCTAIDEAKEAAARCEYEAFTASLQQREERPRKIQLTAEKRHATYVRKKKEKLPIALAPFDPNTADSVSFRRLGLPAWMVQNILKYRAKGGKFRKAEDFGKIYGMTKQQYATLTPYIYIAPQDTAGNTAQLYASQPAPAAMEKYTAGTVVDLNLADTTELKKIPGIGSGIARLIAGYRLRLGGFYRIEQLQEIRLDAALLQSWFSVNPASIRRINLNRSGVDRLRSHPYINFYQAKAIVEYRKKRGRLKSLKPLSLLEEFTEEDMERIGHYVCFE